VQLRAFRILNFRSIIDSGWVPFSPDGITVLVGQNESGKSSVLEALYFALGTEQPTQDDFRIGAADPEVHLRVEMSSEDAAQATNDLSKVSAEVLQSYLLSNKNLVEIECGWYADGSTTTGLTSYYQPLDETLERELTKALEDAAAKAKLGRGNVVASAPILDPASQAVAVADLPDKPEEEDDNVYDLAKEIWRALPLGILFNEEMGRLPSQVDIDDKGEPVGPGARAAVNFLQVAGINLPALIKADRRAREHTLTKANALISQNFNSFWSQNIGKAGGLSLKCSIDNYGANVAGKAGKAHLVFWVCDGTTQLYPKQRSLGVRWFVSFYLQLKAAEKAKSKRVFLLDEPGANLHSKAQGDVLNLINTLAKDTSTVVYSTHSPQMLEYPKLFRVHAVQRDGELDDSPTRIIDAHRLGTASSDTLSPILSAMGADLSQHQVIRKTHNVLLEEMSGYYYLSSFWKLLGVKVVAHFIAATGVNKIEALANMFRGWGLDFIVAVDDDKQGREALKSMKRELFGDDEALASKKLLKLPGCTGIEDAFSKADFSKFILRDENLVVEGINSEFVKKIGRSKPVLAFHFSIAVNDGDIKLADLDAETVGNIENIAKELTARLS
jgi:energy-coupling factor transporter ATP-binding protein EcfA2